MKTPNPYHILGSAVIEWLVGIALGCITWAFVAHGIGCLADTAEAVLCLDYLLL